MEKIQIFKGDDTDFTGNQEIVISIDTDIDITGYTAKFRFLDFEKSFESSEVETKELSIVMSAEVTKRFPLCEQFATLWLFDTNGKTKTLCNRIPVEVTNRACGVVLTDGEIKIRARMKTAWENISGKPQIDDLPERFTDETMRAKVNELAAKVSGRAITMACATLLAFSAFCGLEVQTARKGDIFNDERVVTNVTWSGEAGLGTNEVKDIIHETVDGAARPLPKYLHALDFDDTYPAEAAWYYAQPQDYAACSAVRDGGYLSRNFDFPFDERAEFVVKMSAGPGRFASVGMAQVGTNLTEQMVTSGKPEYSARYKWLPGATVDGINEHGVVAEINVVDGDPQWRSGVPAALQIHPLAAVRWALDHATNAQSAAEYIAAHIAFPPGWTQNFHYMIADETSTYIVENGTASNVTAIAAKRVMTNFPILPDTYEGMGKERYDLLLSSACCITNAWYTRAYHRSTTPPWVSDLREVLAYTNEIFDAWASHPKEYFRNKTNGGEPWWQTVHTSAYDITNRTLRVAVQETDDWYVFAVPSAGGVKPDAVREIVQPMIDEAVADRVRFENLATEWIAGESYTAGQPVYVKVCLTAQKNIFICIKAHDGDDEVNFDDTEYWCPIQDYRFASQDDIPQLPEKWALANVTNASGRAVSAADVGALNAKGESVQGAWIDENMGLFFGNDSGSVGVQYDGFVRMSLGDWFFYGLPRLSGTVAIESWQSLSSMLDDASTNPTTRSSAGAKIMPLIQQPVSNLVVECRDIYHDDELDVTFKKVVSGGRVFMKVIAVDEENAQ